MICGCGWELRLRPEPVQIADHPIGRTTQLQPGVLLARSNLFFASAEDQPGPNFEVDNSNG
jgi:hypothetical protein